MVLGKIFRSVLLYCFVFFLYVQLGWTKGFVLDITANGIYSKIGTGLQSPLSGVSPSMAIGGAGFGLEYRLGSVLGVELTEDYFQRSFTINSPDGSNPALSQSMSVLSSQAGVRFHLGKLGINSGFYYNYCLKNPLNLPLNKSPDYGVYGGIMISVPLSQSVAFFMNPVLHYGLSQIPLTDQNSNAVADANGNPMTDSDGNPLSFFFYDVILKVGLEFGNPKK